MPVGVFWNPASAQTLFGVCLVGKYERAVFHAPLERTPADVATAEAARPVDPVDQRIGETARLGDVRPKTAGVQHPSARGDQRPVLALRGARMKQDRAVLRGRFRA